MVVSELHLYELLRAKLGVAEAEAFVAVLENKVDQKFEDKKGVLATREDIKGLRKEMYDMKAELLRTIYLVSVGQLVAIVGSVLALVTYLK